jgi:hypothetical protein
MQIAVLFDERSPAHKYYAGHTARQAILASGVLQESGRHLVVRAGTILIDHGNPALRAQRVEQAFFSDSWRLLDPVRLRAASQRTPIFAWVISNVDRHTATRLHDSLSAEPTYLGVLAVALAVPAHLGVYRLRLGLLLRIEGRLCSLFWRQSEPDGRDFAEFDHLQSLGFTAVEWEDIGARETVFDDFDTTDHFWRVESLRQLLSAMMPKRTDDADDLLVVLEDLSPRLAATLGTAAASFLRATSEEDFAQVGLSARRYCEQLADALYPARSQSVNGREVSHGKVKNRLWAYIEEQLGGRGVADPTRVQEIGHAVDRVLAIANGELHGAAVGDRIGRLLGDLAQLSAALLELAPRVNRKPYFAYSPRITEILREWFLSAR